MILLTAMQILVAQPLSDRQIHYRPGDWISFPVTRFITAIALDHETVYFGSGEGILRYRYYESRWDAPLTVSDGIEGHAVGALAWDPASGYLWAATDRALNYRVPASDRWHQILNAVPLCGEIRDLGVGVRHLWIRGTQGLFRMERGDVLIREATPDEAEDDRADWGDRPYRDTPENPLLLFPEGGMLFFPEGYLQDTRLRKYPLSRILPDDFSNLWIGTRGLGAARAELLTRTLTLIPHGPFMPDVRAMAWDGGGMWIGGVASREREGGITWWDMESGDWVYFEAPFNADLRSHDVAAIAAGDGAVWFGTRQGLSRYDKQKNAWRTWTVGDGLWSDAVTTLALSEKTLWVGTSLGINEIALPGLTMRRVREKPLVHRRIHFMEPDGDDVWAGTDEGIYRYMSREKRWEYVPGYEGMLVRNVTALSVTDSDIWFGTDDGVAVLDRKTGRWEGYPMDLFFDGDVFNVLLADAENVWAGTNRGVLKFKRAENRWRRFTVADGLLDDAVRWILLEQNHVWFGTARGLTRFYWNAPYRTD